MQRRYPIKQIAKHILLYPMRYFWPRKYEVFLWKRILRFQNSVPLYLVVKPGDVAVQVGTPNIYTLRRYSRLVGRLGKVVVVEADPGNAARLTDSLSSLKYNNAIVVNKGAWSSSDQLKLRKSDEYDGDHRFDVADVFVDNDLRTQLSAYVVVDVEPLDKILASHSISQVNYICVTVNGAELEVLKGASQVLANSIDVRVFSKGHARIGGIEVERESMNELIRSHFLSNGFESVITKGESSPDGVVGWGDRDGDVFAWKPQA